VIIPLRWGKDTYANVRPIKWRPGATSPLRHPEGIDYVIVRENLELDQHEAVQNTSELLCCRRLPQFPLVGDPTVLVPPQVVEPSRTPVDRDRQLDETCTRPREIGRRIGGSAYGR
jgi:hypothetical protein